jgi:DNA-binding NarL/FixJ family response regulator
LRQRAFIRTASSLEAARRSLHELPISGLVLELAVGGDSTLPLVEELRGRRPMLALSATNDVLDASRVAALGATFASKREPPARLRAKLESLAIAAQSHGQTRAAAIERLCASAPFTPAERQTLRVYLTLGRRAALASALGIAETSVRSRVRALCQKLDIDRLCDVYRLLFDLAVTAREN